MNILVLFSTIVVSSGLGLILSFLGLKFVFSILNYSRIKEE